MCTRNEQNAHSSAQLILFPNKRPLVSVCVCVCVSSRLRSWLSNSHTSIGTDCRLIELGGVADATGGVVSIVDATDLEVQLRELIENRIVATLVEATLIAHRLLYWDDEFELSGAAPAVAQPPPPPTGADTTDAAAAAAPVEPPGPKSRLHKTIGNVMAQTTLTFRFGLRPNAKLAANSKLPFQVIDSMILKIMILEFMYTYGKINFIVSNTSMYCTFDFL